MEIANLLYEFFGFDVLAESATFVDLLGTSLKVFCGVYITIFVIRSVFLLLTVPERGLL